MIKNYIDYCYTDKNKSWRDTRRPLRYDLDYNCSKYRIPRHIYLKEMKSCITQNEMSSVNRWQFNPVLYWLQNHLVSSDVWSWPEAQELFDYINSLHAWFVKSNYSIQRSDRTKQIKFVDPYKRFAWVFYSPIVNTWNRKIKYMTNYWQYKNILDYRDIEVAFVPPYPLISLIINSHIDD
jgi:hypothetical protein